MLVLVSRGDMDVAMLSEGIERTPSLFYFQIAILLIRHWRTKVMLFIETSIFTKQIKELVTDDEYRQLQQDLFGRAW